MSVVRTMEQERALHAWKSVKSVSAPQQKEYLRVARHAPAYVQVNGLGQTLSFWLAKKGVHELLYGQVSEWVAGQMGANNTKLLDWVVAPGTGSSQYRRATVEAMAYLGWIKRFAEAEIGEGEGA